MVLHGTIFNTTNVAKIDVCNVSFMGDFQRKIFNATNVAEPKRVIYGWFLTKDSRIFFLMAYFMGRLYYERIHRCLPKSQRKVT